MNFEVGFSLVGGVFGDGFCVVGSLLRGFFFRFCGFWLDSFFISVCCFYWVCWYFYVGVCLLFFCFDRFFLIVRVWYLVIVLF